MKSPKQLAVESRIRAKVKGVAKKAAGILLDDAEIQNLQEFSIPVDPWETVPGFVRCSRIVI